MAGLEFEDPDIFESYKFSNHHAIPMWHVFLRTKSSFAFVNRKPVVKGHVLVSPIRCMERLSQMSADEVSDLFKTVHAVVRKLEVYHGVTAMTVTVQDGELAGQTVKHVHVHILPRREGDFKENEIYKVLATHDKGEAGNTGFKNPGEMTAEALEYRKLFYGIGATSKK